MIVVILATAMMNNIKKKTVNHKHTDNECIHEDGTRHKLHRQTS